MKCNQFHLVSGIKNTICWLDSKVNEGDKIRFKNESRWWDVKEKYDPVLNKEDIKFDWKAGGL